MHDRVLHDRQGNVWFGTRGDGLLHVRSPLASHRPKVEQFTHLAGLISDRVLSLLEDRDGNMWIGTEAGLVCLPLSLSTQLDRPLDLDHRAVHVVVATRDGSVWTGTADGLNRSTRDGSRWYFTRDGLPSNVITALHEDAQGTLWVATDKGMARFIKGRFACVAFSRPPRTERVIAIASDLDGGLWLCEYGGLRRFKDGVLSNVSDPPEVAGRTPIAADMDSRGRVWIGFVDGGVISIYNGVFQAHSPGSGLAGRPVGTIYEDSSGALWLGAYGGLSKYEQGRFTTLTRDKGLPWEYVHTIVEDLERHLWLMTESGLVRFDPREFDQAVRDPSYRIRYRLFDKSDGINGVTWVGSPMSARTNDGKVAFVTSSGMVVLDPARLRTPSPPAVQIERVYADERGLLPAPQLELPPRTSRLQIDYSAISLVGQSKIIGLSLTPLNSSRTSRAAAHVRPSAAVTTNSCRKMQNVRGECPQTALKKPRGNDNPAPIATRSTAAPPRTPARRSRGATRRSAPSRAGPRAPCRSVVLQPIEAFG
jgi:streptogramin lyase